MRSLPFKTGWVVALLLSGVVLTAKAEEENLEPQDLAQRAHNLSQSDVMYQQEDFRALYYQNLEMIQLLKEIRDELHTSNVRDAKDTK